MATFKKYSVSLTNNEGKDVFFTFSTMPEAVSFAQQVRTSTETTVKMWQWNPDTKKSELIDCNDQPDLTVKVHWKAPDGTIGEDPAESVALAEFKANEFVMKGYKAYYTVGKAAFVPKAPKIPEFPEITFVFQLPGKKDKEQKTERMSVDSAMEKLESAKEKGILAAFRHPETGMWVVLSSDPAPKSAPVTPAPIASVAPAPAAAPVATTPAATPAPATPAVSAAPAEVHIWTDGSCKGNGQATNKGGWAAILVVGDHQKEISGGVANTTNNRMEMQSVIEGLKALKKKAVVTIHSDSAYFCNAIQKGWLKKWRDNGWVNSQKKAVENRDLWEEFIALSIEKCVKLSVEKVTGHAGNPLNERCDSMAVAAACAVK